MNNDLVSLINAALTQINETNKTMAEAVQSETEKHNQYKSDIARHRRRIALLREKHGEAFSSICTKVDHTLRDIHTMHNA
jgi:hypothetical protein